MERHTRLKMGLWAVQRSSRPIRRSPEERQSDTWVRSASFPLATFILL